MQANLRNSTVDSRIESDVLRKSHDIHKEGNPRSGSFHPVRSHLYESPKFARGHGVSCDPPPVYHELDPELDEHSGRYTN